MAISHIPNLKQDPHHKDMQKRPQPLNLSTNNLCPKTPLILAAGVEEEDDEQADMTYMLGSLSLP